jgi:hypothetical protein
MINNWDSSMLDRYKKRLTLNNPNGLGRGANALGPAA